MTNASFKLTDGCVVSVFCVGIASLDVVCDECHDCTRILVCSRILISVCMFSVLKALLISSATVIVRAVGLVERLCYCGI